MPSVTLETATGTVVFDYVISTPTTSSAPAIDPTLPTVLFLHPVYLGKIIYHPQFADRTVRRFNLVALDLRCHAQTIGRTGDDYGREVAARDVAQFMTTLQIPQYHLFGTSMGGCIALQTAILFPASVLSVFVVSSLPLIEPPDVGEGRQQIYDYWEEGVKAGEAFEGGAMGDALTGCLQLSINNSPSPLFRAMVHASIPDMKSQWSVERLSDFHVASVKFFTEREAYKVEDMRNISCPVQLVHCSDDIAYDLGTTNEVAKHLYTAGVDVKVSRIPGAPHFGACTHPTEINDLLNKFVLSNSLTPPPPIPETVESPFLSQLLAAGWDPDDTEDIEFFPL